MKRLEINLVDDDNMETQLRDGYILPALRPRLYGFECSNILKKFEGKTLTRDDFRDAINTLIAYFWQEAIHKTIVDIETLDKSLAPAKEMSIEEIEEFLGHKVKIVSDEEEEND